MSSVQIAVWFHVMDMDDMVVAQKYIIIINFIFFNSQLHKRGIRLIIYTVCSYHWEEYNNFFFILKNVFFSVFQVSQYRINTAI